MTAIVGVTAVLGQPTFLPRRRPRSPLLSLVWSILYLRNKKSFKSMESHAGEEIDGNEMHGGFPCMLIVLVYPIAIDPTDEDLSHTW